MISSFNQKRDKNVRTDGDGNIDIVPTIFGVKLENDVMDALIRWNLEYMHPKLREAIDKLIQQYREYLRKNGYGYIH